MLWSFWGDSGGVKLCGKFKRGGGVEDGIFVLFYLVYGVSQYVCYA